MSLAIVITLIILSYIINAGMDAIDHAKGGRTLYELWHILKGLSYAIPFSIILLLLKVNWQVWCLLWIALWVYWEMFYKLFRKMELWKLDDKINIGFVRKLWMLKR